MTNIKITTFEHDGKTYELVTDPNSIKVGQDIYVFDEYLRKTVGYPKRQEVIVSSDHYTDFCNQAPENIVRDWVKEGVVYICTTPVNPHQKLINAKKKYPNLVIEFKNKGTGEWEFINKPAWLKSVEYRIQPKREVKYRFAYESELGLNSVSSNLVTEETFKKFANQYNVRNYTRLDWTKQVTETPVEIPE